MQRGEQKTHPIQVVINYWEIRPTRMGFRLDDLVRNGIREVTAFIPWQALESDIAHTLLRFIQATRERGMQVHLIATPEVAVHFPLSGLPRDLVSRPENLALSSENKPVVVSMAPSSFAIPSMVSPEFVKRYSNYLSRLEGIFVEACKVNREAMDHVMIDVSGSYWKYLRSPAESELRGASAECGDYSAAASLHFRQAVDRFYAEPEFSHPSPIAANRWKMRAMETVNRRWVTDQAEHQFRERTESMLKRRSAQIKFQQIELHTPEADPALHYAEIARRISGRAADFFRLSRMVSESAPQSGSTRVPVLHWSAIGGFHTLSDPQRQFLILKSLLLVGAQGGRILIDESEWLALSPTFRGRCETLSRALSQRAMHLDEQVMLCSPQVWGAAPAVWDEFTRRVGERVRRVSVIPEHSTAKVLVVDGSMILHQRRLHEFKRWLVADRSRVLVMPRDGLLSEGARLEWMRWCQAGQSIRISRELAGGVGYEVLDFEDAGRLVIYEPLSADRSEAEAKTAWKQLVRSVLGMAEIREACRFSDSRLEAVQLQSSPGVSAAFVMNSTTTPVHADMLFGELVKIGDMVAVLQGHPDGGMLDAPAADRFALEVPAFGVLPVALHYQRDARASRDSHSVPEVLTVSPLVAPLATTPTDRESGSESTAGTFA